MCQGLALVFFDKSLSKKTYARVAVLASVWALFYATANVGAAVLLLLLLLLCHSCWGHDCT